MVENRVRVKDKGRIPNEHDPRLVSIPSAPGYACKMHYLAAAAFTVMASACYAATGIQLKARSGWRAHRWSSRAEYEAYLVAHYGNVEAGRKWVAFDSPHETGLAVDLQCGGLAPISKTAAQQKRTVVYAWLCDHAAEFGFSPYLPEPWHWEYNIPKTDWERLP